MNNFSFDKIYNQIKTETNKYSDISNVYQKLQDCGHIKTIHELIHQIFIQEKKYTFDEISKIIQAYPNKKINLESQLKLNGAIFKTNFHLIIDIIIDMISSDVYNMDVSGESMTEIKPDKFGMSQKSLNLSASKIISPTNKSPTSTKNLKSNLKNPNQNSAISMKHAKQERKNPRMKNTKIPAGLSTSVVVTRNDARAFKKKKQTDKAETNNTSFLSQKNPRLNQTTNSFYSHSTVYPNLDSEFSYVGGKSTFSFQKTERMKDPKDISPGPIYDSQKAMLLTRKKSPDVKFDKAEKTSWFDDKFKAGSESPGFIYNPTKHYVTK